MAADDASSAYVIQDLNVRHWRNSGRRVAGRKVGLTARAAQLQFGVDEPDFGTLFEDMQIPSGGLLSPARAIQPRAEAEIAIILGKDVDDCEASQNTILEAAAQAVAAIEIVDSRIGDWKISFADTVADNGSAGFFVLGDEPRSVEGLDLYTCGMVLELNGTVASLGAGAACLGHPLNSAAWLARTLSAAGNPLRAGDVILTGALGPMVPIAPGDQIVVRIAGLGEASLTYR